MSEQIAHPEVVVDTEWVFERLDDPAIRIVEIDAHPENSYALGHIPGAVVWGLHTDLEDQVRRDIPNIAQFEALMSRSGIANDTTVILYGDGNNRSATWAFWIMKYYRHPDVRLMDGGRKKWMMEARPMTVDVPLSISTTSYRAGAPDRSLRASRDYVLQNLDNPNVRLLDTRSREEYVGELTSAPGTPQPEIYRKGHIPGAKHFPWEEAAAEDGSFKPVEDLRRMYKDLGVESSNEVVPYCRLGMRASYSWFVLKYVLGLDRVRNYDGSWTEWGNATGVPINVGNEP